MLALLESLSTKFDALRQDVDLLKERDAAHRSSRSGDSENDPASDGDADEASDEDSDKEREHRVRRTRQNLQEEKPRNNRSPRSRAPARASYRDSTPRSRSRSETPPRRSLPQRGTTRRGHSTERSSRNRTRSRSATPTSRDPRGTGASNSPRPPRSRKGKEPASKRSWPDIMSEGEEEPLLLWSYYVRGLRAGGLDGPKANCSHRENGAFFERKVYLESNKPRRAKNQRTVQAY